jgi:tetratricopeptide (TPR) repeat protein
VHEHFGQWDKARQCYKEALALNPDYAAARHAYRMLMGKMN